MPSNCAIATCKNYEKSVKRDKSISYHLFPKDKKLAALWLNKCRRKDKVNLKSARVCSIHFTEEEIIIDRINRTLGLKERTKLKKGAIPSLHLPVPEPIKITTPSERAVRLKKRHNEPG